MAQGLSRPTPPRRGPDAAHALNVVEIFGPTLQGEGRLIGCTTMFVRLAGCDWTCAWCDSAFTWQAGALAPIERLTPEAIVRRLAAAGPTCRRVTLSGGNPALQDAGPLVDVLRARGYRVHVETQGSRAPAWLARVDMVTVSPKGPSSNMPPAWDALAATLRVAAAPDLKIVVFDEADYAFAREVHRRHPTVACTLQAGNRVGRDRRSRLLARLRWLAGRTLADPDMADVRVLPQLHVLLWGNRRGV